MGKDGRTIQAADDYVIRRMRFACCITKATDTLRICNTYCFSAARMVTRALYVLLYSKCTCFILLFALDRSRDRPADLFSE